MKKLLLTLIAAVAITGSALAEHPKNIFGIRAGLNVANMTTTIAGEGETKSRAGFHVGISDQIRLSKIAPMYFETGLYLTQKGLKQYEMVGRPLYLQIPALLNYHIYLSEHTSIDPFAGFYYGFGIGGRLENPEFRESAPFFSSEAGFKRSDLGARFGVNISFLRHLSLGIGYETSLINITQKDDFKTTNHTLTFSLGYNF